MSARAALAAQVRAGTTPSATPTRKPRSAPEADAQRAIVAALRHGLPRDAIIHHSPHEERGSGPQARRRQGIVKGMGVHPGFADLIVLVGGRVIFLEVKSSRGTQSPVQRQFQAAVEQQGHSYAVVRTIDDAVAVLAALGVPLRVVTIKRMR